MADKDYYDILHIDSNATPDEVTAAYHNLVAHNKTNADVELAYQTLSDPAKRAEYDEHYIGPFNPSDSYLVEDLDTITAEKKYIHILSR